jgi:hypothetical protein
MSILHPGKSCASGSTDARYHVVGAICLTMLHCATRFMMAYARRWQKILSARAPR